MRSVTNLRSAGEGFVPPGAKDFVLPPIFDSIPWLTKPILLVALSVILVSVFFILSSRKAAMVPSKLQFAGEGVYGFIRNGMAKDVIGPEFMRFVPFLFTLFTFVLVNNWFAIVPMLQFPTFSRVGFAYALALITYVVYHSVGVKKQGLFGYIKGIAFMPGVPKPIYLLLTPIEIATFFIVRPFTFGSSFVCKHVCWTPFAFSFLPRRRASFAGRYRPQDRESIRLHRRNWAHIF